MSDAGRKMDVEDVLSSIRRLVSEEARTAPETADSQADAPKSEENMLQAGNATEQDKLVLTPSLRVSEAIAPPPIQAEIEQRIADIESLVMSEAVASTQAEIAAAVEVQDTDDESSAEIQTLDDTVEPPKDVEADLAASNSNSEMMSALHLSMRDFARAEPPLTANLSNAPAEETVANDAEEVALEEQPQDSFDAEVAEFYDIPADEDATAQTPDVEVEETSVDESQDPEPTDTPFAPAAEFEAPEPVFVHAELDRTPEETPRETIINREPPLTSEAKENTEENPFADDAIDYTEADDTFLDEETLREMVSDMVRSELQGELGDRITRNVRKLVRREIYRAMASRDFE